MKRFVLASLLMASMAGAGSLFGALIVADDGTFLGTCSGSYSADSISNDYGVYGSKYGSESMYNPYGQYGSQYASNSPFNPYGRPAYLLDSDPDLVSLFTSSTYRPTPAIVTALHASGPGHVTANSNDPQGVDPNVLRVVCRNP